MASYRVEKRLAVVCYLHKSVAILHRRLQYRFYIIIVDRP